MSNDTSEPGIAEDDRALYANLLKQQKLRSGVAEMLLGAEQSLPNIESAALQLRFVLELIPLAALIANRDWVEPVSAAFDRKDPMDARKLVKRINPEYWPVPGIRESYQRGAPGERGRHTFVGIRDGFLTEPDWPSEWGYVSSLLHARNPYRESYDLGEAHAHLQELLARIRKLLACHLLLLPSHDVSLMGFLEMSDGESAVFSLSRPAGNG